MQASILNLYEAGEQISTIAKKVGVHISTVQSVTHRKGIRRSRSDAQAIRAIRDPSIGKMWGRSCAFHSKKNERWFPASSAYEYARMIQLDEDDKVLSWQRCPDRIPYFIDGKRRIYNPDLEVLISDGSIVIEEIKPSCQVNSERNKAKFAAAKEFYAMTEKNFVVVTEDFFGIKDAARLIGKTSLSSIPEVERKERVRLIMRRFEERLGKDELAARRRKYAQSKKEKARMKKLFLEQCVVMV